jgi:hypothetical protein
MSRAAKAQWEQQHRNGIAPGGQPKKFLKVDQEQQIKALAAIGCTNREIATVIGLNRETLEQRYGDLILTGKERMNVSLRRRQLAKAVDEGNTAMLIWMGKQYLGQAENPAQNLTVNGENIQINILPPGSNSPPQVIEGRSQEENEGENSQNTGGTLSQSDLIG